MVNRYGRRSILSVREQRARMLRELPRFRSRIVDGALVAIGDLQPTARSAIYTVRIDYRVGDSPNVSVLSPKLVPLEESGRLKHVYPGNRLCLYTPYMEEWTPDMSLPHTIVPWIAEWLYYYELWHATGEWLGGGSEPLERQTIRNEKEPRHERE